jgi:hypothetical protein
MVVLHSCRKTLPYVTVAAPIRASRISGFSLAPNLTVRELVSRQLVVISGHSTGIESDLGPAAFLALIA